MMRKILLTAAILGTLFQIGHFTEHAIQAHEWLFTDRTQPWMSGLAMLLTTLISSNMAKGMEVLHLGGNLVFLATLWLWMELKPGNVWFRRGFIVEAFHLTEHIALTATVFLYGHAVGWSTGFGFAPALLGHDGAVGYRVLWHFGMNLVPSVLMLWGMVSPKPDIRAVPDINDFDGVEVEKPTLLPGCACPCGWNSRGTDAV